MWLQRFIICVTKVINGNKLWKLEETGGKRLEIFESTVKKCFINIYAEILPLLTEGNLVSRVNFNMVTIAARTFEKIISD